MSISHKSFVVKATLCTILAMILVAFGSSLYVFLPKYVQSEVTKIFAVTDVSSFQFPLFSNQTKKVDLYEGVYLYDIANKEGILKRGEVPVLIQRGPFTYQARQWRVMNDIAWRVNGTIDYTFHRVFNFNAERSNGSETDVIRTVNLGVIGVLAQVKEMTKNHTTLQKMALDAIFTLMEVEKQQWIMELSAKEIILGYNNSFLLSIKTLLHDFGIHIDVSPLVQLVINDDPDYYTKISSVYSGGPAADGVPQPPENCLMCISRWLGQDKLTYWNTDYGNMINGTDGTSFQPGFKETDAPYVFVDAVYRSFKMHVTKTKTYKGVKLFEVKMEHNQFVDETWNPDNAAFNMVTTGFFPFPAALGKPIYISLPHFLHGNWSAPDVNVTYIPDDNFNIERYDIILSLEPITGELFESKERVQINTYIMPGVTFPAGTVNTYMPIGYFDKHYIIPDNLLNEYKSRVQAPINVGIYGGISIIVLGCIIMALTVAISIRRIFNTIVGRYYGGDHNNIMSGWRVNGSVGGIEEPFKSSSSFKSSGPQEAVAGEADSKG